MRQTTYSSSSQESESKVTTSEDRTKEYPGPLLPSKYRELFRSDDHLEIAGDFRVRKTGYYFHQITSFLDKRYYISDDDYMKEILIDTNTRFHDVPCPQRVWLSSCRKLVSTGRKLIRRAGRNL